MGLVRSIHEQERAKRELEHTLIEKEAMEKVLKACLSEVVESSLAKAMPEGCMAGSGKHGMRIDITCLGQNRAAIKTNNIQYQPNKQSMKTKAKTILLAAATLAGMTACTNDDNNVAVDNNAPVAVRITAGIAVATPGTRVVGSRWYGDQIGVIVSSSSGSNMFKNYRNANYVTSVSGEEEAAFTPKDEANTIYFDNDNDVSFKAYAPYQPSASPATLPGTDGVIIINATNQATPEEQEAIDFITSAGAVVATKSNPQVAFNGEHNFTHIMSRLVLKIEIPEVDGVLSSAEDRISGISLGGLCTGGTFDLNDFIMSDNIPQPDRNTWTENWDIPKCVEDKTNDAVTYTLIFIPQHATDQTGTPRDDVSVNITLDGKSYEMTIIGDTDDPGNFSSGKSYEWTIHFTKTGIKVGGSAVKDWTIVANTEINKSL